MLSSHDWSGGRQRIEARAADGTCLGNQGRHDDSPRLNSKLPLPCSTHAHCIHEQAFWVMQHPPDHPVVLLVIEHRGYPAFCIDCTCAKYIQRWSPLKRPPGSLLIFSFISRRKSGFEKGIQVQESDPTPNPLVLLHNQRQLRAT